MIKVSLAALAAVAISGAAGAQDLEAPDGSRAFGFEPYVAIGGGYLEFTGNQVDRQLGFDNAEGAMITGTLGANVPLGAFFVGAEGFGSYGFEDIDWVYGAAGRFGIRVGESGLFFGRVGYVWVEGENDSNDDFLDFDGFDDDDEDRLTVSPLDGDAVLVGFGVEVGPQDIGLGGLTGESGVRLRLGVDTDGDVATFRPNGALVFHF